MLWQVMGALFVLAFTAFVYTESRKLFKTPIFERWGKQFCLN